VNEQIQYVRENFEKKYADNIASGLYDSRDLDRLRRDSVYVRTFIRGNDRLDEGVDLVHSSFKFRKEVKAHDLCEESFDKELFELGGMYFHKKDINGQRIMWLRVKLHRKDASAERLATEKLALIFAMEKAFNEDPLSRIVVLLDMSSCGLANLDIDFVKYIISCFKFYYPTFLAYMLIYDMPWIFNAAWRVIKAWLNAEAAAKIKFVTKADVQNYIKAEDLPPYMGGTDSFEFVFKPGMCSEPLYPEDEKKNDKKVHFQEAQEEAKVLTQAHASPDLFDHNSNSSNVLRHRTSNHNNNAGESRVRPLRSLVLGRSPFLASSSTYVGRLLTVSPADELVFQPGDTGDSFDVITMTNTLPVPVAFKVKTTSPEKFRVRPSAGIIAPEKKEEVYVYLVPDVRADITKEKFLIMAMETTPGNATDPITMFKDAPKDAVMQHKLKCSQTGAPVGPPAGAVRPSGGQDTLASKVEQLETQTRHMQRQLNLLLVIQFLTAFTLIIVMLAYSCFGEDLFTRFLALPFDFCNDPYGRKC
ncbi:unnamed protein product, partial [Lymnaea stagnalis]